MHKHIPILAALLTLSALPPAAAAVPLLGVEKTCHAAQPLFGRDTADDAGKSASDRKLGNSNDARNYQNCMLSEAAARKSSADLWSKVDAGNRAICIGLARMVYPSYVELMSCLQMYDRTAPGAKTTD